MAEVISPQTWQEGVEILLGFTSSNELNSTISEAVVLMKNSTLTITDLNCNPSNASNCVSACHMIGGHWNESVMSCYVYYVLSGYCVKVGLYNTPQGIQWLPSDQYGGSGCGLENNWQTTHYSQIAYPIGNKNLTSFTGLITIRSAFDPYIVALHLTNGTLNFHWDLQDEAAVGSSILISGGAFMFFAVVFSYFVIRHYRRKHNPENLPISKLEIAEKWDHRNMRYTL